MTQNSKSKLIVILGPTAIGKTKLAVKLARDFNSSPRSRSSEAGSPREAGGEAGEIVSADSRQVYKGMDVGTGKDLGEYKFKIQNSKFKTIPYHLIDVVSPKKRFSLAQYQKLAYQAIDDIIKRGKVPFLVGGTGLYIQAIVDGYQLTAVKPNLKLRKELNKKSLKQLQSLAKKYGVKLNQSDWNNKIRLIRLLEKQRAKNKEQKTNNPKYQCLLLGIKYPRKILNKRIDKRLKYQLEKEGLISEVKKLRKQGLSWKRLDDFGLEYRFIAKYLKGELKYDEMVKKLAMATHQFAKRQMTWFKRDKKIKWIKNYSEAKKMIDDFLLSNLK